MRHNVKWQVSLSNGSTFFEDKGNFIDLEGQPSPWQRLLLYMHDTGTWITSLSLYDDAGHHWNLPSAGKNPKFSDFHNAPKPVGFSCFRKLGMDIAASGEASQSALFCVAQAEMEQGFFELWVDNENPKNCWGLYREK